MTKSVKKLLVLFHSRTLEGLLIRSLIVHLGVVGPRYMHQGSNFKPETSYIHVSIWLWKGLSDVKVNSFKVYKPIDTIKVLGLRL